MALFRFHPLTVKRWRRFRENRRGYWSFWLLLAVFAASLVAEIITNSRPLLLRFEGKWHCPPLEYASEDDFLHNGVQKPVDYKKLAESPEFAAGRGLAVWPLLPCGPLEVIPHAELQPYLRQELRLSLQPRLASVTVDADLAILEQTSLEALGDGQENLPTLLSDCWEIPEALRGELALRLANGDARPRQEFLCRGRNGFPAVVAVLASRSVRKRAPSRLRLTLRHAQDEAAEQGGFWTFSAGEQRPVGKKEAFIALPPEIRETAERLLAEELRTNEPQSASQESGGRCWELKVAREVLRFPFRPIPGHWCGLDEAGRDVLSRIVYGLRSSLSFGLILAVCSMLLGTLAGMIQGYVGGWCDILGQRLIEIWSSLPFLYIIILMGSIYGPGFSLLIFCYALFNWVGISAYMRAEMLRLRHLPFAEAARCLGIPGWKIAVKHILPNALVPLVTFFPFNLVGAISSLAALDYLGFGLPPPTPSLGQLLQQAQSQRWAWWLILYPSLTLFVIMMLGIFVGEGVREAFDPRRQSRLQ